MMQLTVGIMWISHTMQVTLILLVVRLLEEIRGFVLVEVSPALVLIEAVLIVVPLGLVLGIVAATLGVPGVEVALVRLTILVIKVIKVLVKVVNLTLVPPLPFLVEHLIAPVLRHVSEEVTHLELLNAPLITVIEGVTEVMTVSGDELSEVLIILKVLLEGEDNTGITLLVVVIVAEGVEVLLQLLIEVVPAEVIVHASFQPTLTELIVEDQAFKQIVVFKLHAQEDFSGAGCELLWVTAVVGSAVGLVSMLAEI